MRFLLTAICLLFFSVPAVAQCAHGRIPDPCTMTFDPAWLENNTWDCAEEPPPGEEWVIDQDCKDAAEDLFESDWQDAADAACVVYCDHYNDYLDWVTEVCLLLPPVASLVCIRDRLATLKTDLDAAHDAWLDAIEVIENTFEATDCCESVPVQPARPFMYVAAVASQSHSPLGIGFSL